MDEQPSTTMLQSSSDSSSVKRHSVPVNNNNSNNNSPTVTAGNSKDWKFMEENIENIYLKQQRRLSNNSNKTKVILTKIPKRNTIALDSGLAEQFAYQQQQQQNMQSFPQENVEQSHIPIFHFRVQNSDKRKATTFSQNMFENLLQQQQQGQPQPQGQQPFYASTAATTSSSTPSISSNNNSPVPLSPNPYENVDMVEKLINSKQFKFNLENNRIPGIVKQSKRYSTDLSRSSPMPTSPTTTSTAMNATTTSAINPLLLGGNITTATSTSNTSSPRDNSSTLLQQQLQQMTLLSHENVRLSGENQQLKHDKLLLEHRVNELNSSLEKLRLQVQQFQHHLLYQQQQQQQLQQLQQQLQLQQQQQQQQQNSVLFSAPEPASLLSSNEAMLSPSELDDLLFN